MRFLKLRTRPGRSAELFRFYRERVLPALEGTRGCLFASLLQQSHQADEFLSMTIWESPEAARDYERGVYRRLLRETTALPVETAEWRLKLSDDPTETAELGLEEPPKDAWKVESAGGALDAEPGPRLYMRVVSVHVEQDRVAEFQKLFHEQVEPALRKLNGCRDVILVQGHQRPERFLSISFWEREEDAVRYEISGEFDRLTEVLKPTLSARYRWRIHLVPASGESDGLDVKGYRVVAGKKL